jgi:hypothetical protein
MHGTGFGASNEEWSAGVARHRTAAEAIEELLQSASRGAALSLARAVRAIRTMVPDCDSTDRELCDLVTASALSEGFSVLLFDTAAPNRYALDADNMPSSSSTQTLSGPGRKVIAFVPELQRAALRITGSRRAGDDLVEQVLKFAISSIDHRPQTQSVEDWLLELIRHFGSASRTRH